MEGDGNSGGKLSTDSLSKIWKPLFSLVPFYSGGKLFPLQIRNEFCCLHDSRINFLSAETFAINREISLENEELTCFCVSPDEKTLTTFSRNLLLRVWDTNTLVCESTIKGHKMPVLCMAYHRSGTLVATGSTDGIVRVWDISRGYCTHSFKYHQDVIRLLQFIPNSNHLYLFSSSDDCSLKVLNLIDSNCIGDFTQHLSAPTSIAFTDDNEIMVSVARDKVMNFYWLNSFSFIKSQALFEELETVLILPCRKRKDITDHVSHMLIAGGERGTLMFFRLDYQPGNSFSCTHQTAINIDTGAILNDISPHFQASCGINSVEYLESSQRLIVTTTDNRILLFSMNTSFPLFISPLSRHVGSFDDILGISLLPDPSLALQTASLGAIGQRLPLFESTRLAVVSNSPVVHLLDKDASAIQLVGHTDIVLAVQCSVDGYSIYSPASLIHRNWIITSSKDCTCRVWSTKSSTCVGITTEHTDAVSTIALSQRMASYITNCAIFVSGGGDKVLKRWRIPNSSTPEAVVLSATHSVRAHEKDINTLAISPNDAIVASGSHDSRIRIWNSHDLSPVVSLVGHRKSIWCVRFSPVDKCLASSSGDRTVKIWSLTDYCCLRTLQGHTASVLCLQFVRHGMQIISAAADGLLYLWTIRTGEQEYILDRHSEKVWSLEKLQVQGTELLLSCGSDSQILTWYDATPEEELKRIEKSENAMLMEQQLGNCIRLKKYSEALSIAFELKYPNKILQILQIILAGVESSEENSFNYYARKWSKDEVAQVIEYIKDWNTNSRYSYVVHTLFQSLIEVFGVANFLNVPNVSDSLLSLSSYGERHFQRVDRLNESIYLLEYLDSESSLSSEKIY